MSGWWLWAKARAKAGLKGICVNRVGGAHTWNLKVHLYRLLFNCKANERVAL